MEKLKMQSRDVVGSNVEKIAALFPLCITERLNKDGKPELAIDFDKLRAELSNEVLEDSEERYQFTWPDKRAASRLANEPTTMTLRPCREESVDYDNTENLYIEGDNLDVLKVLRETYLGRVKMIYIDPPYNTGNDFVYNDDFAQGKEDFEQGSGLFDAEGYNTPRFSDRHNYGGMTRNRYICKKEENQNGKTIEIYSFFQGESRRGSAQGNGATGVAGQEIWRGTLENYRMEERVA